MTGDDAEASTETIASATEEVGREERRAPLAYDVDGNPMQLPRDAVAWRVRVAGKGRGRPRHVFDADTGRQLEIPITSAIEDLAASNIRPGRYLLYAIDAQGTILPHLVAVTELRHDGEEEDEGEEEDQPAEPRAGLRDESADPLIGLIARQQSTIEEAMRSHVAQGAQLVAALGSALGGYAPVRPPQLSPPSMMAPPVVLSAPMAPTPPAEGLVAQLSKLQPDQLQMWAVIARQVWESIKGAMPPEVVAAAAGGGLGAGGP